MQARSEAVGHSPRGYMEIAYSILSVCLNGALKTHVMFRCNLNSKQLQFYLESLEGKGFIESGRIPPSVKVEYRTTDRGRRYMETYDRLIQLLSDEEPREIARYA